jgi:pimeloyl-ACP methyl ester carboxylesterase
MPLVTSRKANIYWESHGKGEPVLMIMGLSFPLEMWHRVLPAISARYRAIVFDNRGVGRSDVPRGPYRIAAMARDAAAVMDAAGIGSAHVMGASMGGMIAQELALRNPERVRSLLLGCTSCGGFRARPPNLRRVPIFRNWRGLTNEQRARAVVPMLYGPRTPREVIEEDLEVRLIRYPTMRGVLYQAMAIPFWSSYRRLHRLHMPVLVMHGDKDRVLPPLNGTRLAARIPGAKLVMIPDAGHMLTSDAPYETMGAILSFLERAENGRRESKSIELISG